MCGTNAFGGYHSVSDVGHGVTIYAVTIDPIIEAGPISPGGDPQGNPDAEVTADIAGHETVEAMTDPEGVGYMDPNGFEVADKCEFGPQHGTPLGFAGERLAVQPGHQRPQVPAPGDVVKRRQRLRAGDDSTTANPLPLPQVNLTQFSAAVTRQHRRQPRPASASRVSLSCGRRQRQPGDGRAGHRAPPTAAGSWSVTFGSHVVGDDRDEIDVDYSGAGAPTPNHQVILTGNGGNPFTESGWTGWTALDNGSLP